METRAKAIGYVRVSTADQAREGVSLEAQRAKIEAWAEANGYELLAVKVDAGISGGKMRNRPGLQEALAEACKHKAALVVYSLSRLARSTRDALEISERLDKAGADLVSLSERIDSTSAAGKLLFRVLAVLAEFERDIIAERTSCAMQHKKARLERVGGVPYGFQEAAGRLVPDTLEQRGLQRLRGLRAQGLSYGLVADRLNSDGFIAKEGGKWYAASVRYVFLHSPIIQAA